MSTGQWQLDALSAMKKPLQVLATGSLMLQLGSLTAPVAWADEPPAPAETVVSSSSSIAKVPLYTKRSTDLQAYTDINRGFKMLRYIIVQSILEY